jgi:hypothetical protein
MNTWPSEQQGRSVGGLSGREHGLLGATLETCVWDVPGSNIGRGKTILSLFVFYISSSMQVPACYASAVYSTCSKNDYRKISGSKTSSSV